MVLKVILLFVVALALVEAKALSTVPERVTLPSNKSLDQLLNELKDFEKERDKALVEAADKLSSQENKEVKELLWKMAKFNLVLVDWRKTYEDYKDSYGTSPVGKLDEPSPYHSSHAKLWAEITEFFGRLSPLVNKLPPGTQEDLKFKAMDESYGATYLNLWAVGVRLPKVDLSNILKKVETQSGSIISR